MNTVQIIEIGINTFGGIYVKPSEKKYLLIWRSGTEVHWSEKENYLYSPLPREWSYLDWYNHIVSVIKTECNDTLEIVHDTLWCNVPDDLKKDIIASSGLNKLKPKQ